MPYVLSGLQLKIFSSVRLRLPPQLGWEGGRGAGGDDEWPADTAEAKVCLALPSSPPPGHLLPVRTLSPYFCLSGGHEEIKRSSGCEGHRGKPQSLARPNFKRQLPPTLHCPALHPTCSDTHGCFSLGTTINNSRCPGSGMAGVQTELSMILEVLSLTHLAFPQQVHKPLTSPPSRQLPDTPGEILASCPAFSSLACLVSWLFMPCLSPTTLEVL